MFPQWYMFPAHAGNNIYILKPLYVLSSWLYDYKLGLLSPGPITDVGNGLLWTYLVVPILVVALIVGILRIRKIKGFHPSAILLVFLVLFYYFMDMSVVARFMLGFNIFIMAWAFAWIIGTIKETEWTLPSWLKTTVICFMLLPALLSFFQAIKGAFFQYKVVSVLEGQRQLFPMYIDAISFQKRYCAMLLKDYKAKQLPENTQFLIKECEAQAYKYPFAGQDRKFSLQDYQFSGVLRNYKTLQFMKYDTRHVTVYPSDVTF